MKAAKVIRVAVLGTPQTEQWLMVRAFAASHERSRAYELVTDCTARQPDMYVIDPENDHAITRWARLDSKGTVPAAFFTRVHPRAKCAVVVSRPHTSGSVVDALDQLARRVLEVSGVSRIESRPVRKELTLAAA